ncbi:MAG: endonuclease/exonuclease/phosphatase family protein [Planctomycetales bacterium]|nr:endonuclease/exonuclease/phosphatase family protein [Planctomycetales bacterium]
MTTAPHDNRQPATTDKTSSASAVAKRRRVFGWMLGALIVAAVLASGADRRAAAPVAGQLLTPAGRQAAAAETWPLRLASFNIHGGRDEAGRPSLEDVRRTIVATDVIGLNEVRTIGVAGLTDQAHELAGPSGFGVVFAPAEVRWWRPRLGNALLSNTALRSWHTVPLHNTRGKAFRNAIVAQVEHGGLTVHVMVTHVDNYEDHEVQLNQVSEKFLELPEPAVLLGDLNTRRDDPQLQRLLAQEGVVDAVAAGAPSGLADDGRIDWILVRGLDVVRSGVVDLGASDHPCVWADVQPRSQGEGGQELADAPRIEFDRRR